MSRFDFSLQVAGFLTVFSSELSVFVLMVITMERWYAISYAIHLTKRLRIRQAWGLMVTGWLYASTMALLPLVGVSGYGAVSICLPMEAKDVWDKLYIIALLVLNGLAFLVICCCYISMFMKVGGGGSAVAKGPASTIGNLRTTVGQNRQLPWEQTGSDFTVGQCLVSDVGIVHARFLSDTTRCPMVTSRSVCCAAVGRNRQLQWEQADLDSTDGQ